MKRLYRKSVFLLITIISILTMGTNTIFAEISATHVYHNHMPNFWPYYNLESYSSTAVGSPIRYTYDGQVIDLKKNPPSNYTYYLPNGSPMPHDDLVSYYSHHAKTGAYLYWPWQVASTLKNDHPSAQMQVTMSGSLINNVNSFMSTNNVPGYNDPNWGQPWKNAYDTLRTPNGNRTLDLVHFSGHHTMGPLVGNEYLLKDLIYQNATLAQPYFLGNSFTSSKGYFPTELGFSERIIPVLAKLGIEWSVIGNNHFSRTLKDYPLLNDPGKDTMVSPPNRADLQNTSNVGDWVAQPMFNEKQVVYNKYPFASTPHWVKYVDPKTGVEDRIVGIPVAQAESWEEGYQGSVKATALKPFEGLTSQKQFFVIAHDGDNSSGRAGSEDTWRNAGNVTYSDQGVKGEGINEYLKNNTPAANDVVHVQDGSWIDTRDSSSDPQWHHWKLPFGIWKGQFADFNRVTGLNLAPKKNLSGVEDGMTVSFEYGYHYLERNFALLQAAENYAKTAEQIWLGDHLNYWSPTTQLDRQITYQGNQLNPWMISYPVKGNASNDYKGGANPAELGWYFLLPAMDSGFGYYDENVDDSVKPTLAFNNSLYFTKPYVEQNISKDKVGPSVWWPQRWPYNPGSANVDKSEGWTLHHFDNTFGIYTYAYDVNDIQDIKVKIRTHRDKSADVTDNTFRVYDPEVLAAQGIANIDPSKVSDWIEYPMLKRELKPDINGLAWQASSKQIMEKVPAQEIGDLYYTYLSDYRDQLVDYYIEAVDASGNVTKTEIQSVYVGAGKYSKDASGKIVEDVNGTITGTHPFLVVDNESPTAPTGLTTTNKTDRSITLSWTASTDNVGVTGYEIFRDGTKVGTSTTTSYVDSNLTPQTSYEYTIKAKDAANHLSSASESLIVATLESDSVPPTAPANVISSSKTSSSITLTWDVATDNYGVAGYEIYRNGVKVGTSNTTSFEDRNLEPSTEYTYTVKAFDAAANLSVASIALKVNTDSGNVVTLYYKQGYTTPYLHYRVIGGTWTTAPGVVIPSSNISGYNSIKLNIGAASGIEAVFNNGSGTWDNNGGKNYIFPAGTSTYENGIIKTGAPVSNEDTIAPTAPANLQSTAKTSSTVTLSWGASSDNVGVAGYEIWRNNTKVGNTSQTTYSDTNLAANTEYTYIVKAYDAKQNVSNPSNTLQVTTNPVAQTNEATIYYKQGYALPYLHYAPSNGTWTTAPGLKMEVSEIAGYSKITVNLGTATSMQAVFNNGSGTWDNNGGRNYTFSKGVSTFNNGVITSGAPTVAVQEGLTIRVTVPSNTPVNESIYLTSNISGWNPGDATLKLTRNEDGKYSITLPISAGTKLDFKFTRGTWNNVEVNGSGSDLSNRTYTMSGISQTLDLTVQKWKDK